MVYINFDTLDHTVLVIPTAPLLRDCLNSSGISIWSLVDGVHLFTSAFHDLACAFIDDGETNGSENGGPDAPMKWNPASVLLLPKPPAAKKGRFARPPATAGWLRGKVSLGAGGWGGGARRGGRPGARGRYGRGSSGG
jgi:hypothetical protein